MGTSLDNNSKQTTIKINIKHIHPLKIWNNIVNLLIFNLFSQNKLSLYLMML